MRDARGYHDRLQSSVFGRLVDPEDPTSNIGLRIVFAKADEVNYSSSLDLNNICIRFLKNQQESMAEN